MHPRHSKGIARSLALYEDDDDRLQYSLSALARSLFLPPLLHCFRALSFFLLGFVRVCVRAWGERVKEKAPKKERKKRGCCEDGLGLLFLLLLKASFPFRLLSRLSFREDSIERAQIRAGEREHSAFLNHGDIGERSILNP